MNPPCEIAADRARMATPPPSRPKPRVSLEEARELAARANQMRWAQDRPEDPDA